MSQQTAGTNGQAVECHKPFIRRRGRGWVFLGIYSVWAPMPFWILLLGGPFPVKAQPIEPRLTSGGKETNPVILTLDYKPCSPSLEFGFTGLTLWARGNSVGSGSFERLTLNNRVIQVVTNQIGDGGFILTKDFGNIMIKPKSMGNVQVCLKPEQETRFVNFLHDSGTVAKATSASEHVLPLAGGTGKGDNLSELKGRAEKGDVDAQYNLGVGYYYGGKGVSQDYSEAATWFRKAADTGYPPAQCFLGLCCFKGNGVPKDNSEAFKWYRKAAEQGNAVAQSNVGVCYWKGLGVAKDMTETVKWCLKAADQGNAVAQCDMGDLYRDGLGVAKDNNQAMSWYRKAADQGNARGQCSVAWDAAVKKGTIDAYLNFANEYPKSEHIQTRTGTVRGRYWYKVALPFAKAEAPASGVLVTVEGTPLLRNVSLKEAKIQRLLDIKAATGGQEIKASGKTFNVTCLEVTTGAALVDGEIIVPRDSKDAKLVISGDGNTLLAWDLKNAEPTDHPDEKATYVDVKANKAWLPEP